MVKRWYVFLFSLTLGLSTFSGQVFGIQTEDEADKASAIEVAPADDAPRAKVASEELLPASTKAWFSVPDVEALEKGFQATQLGKLTEDEALKPFIEGLEGQLKGWINEKNLRLGLKIEDVEEIRTGEVCLAGVLPGGIPGEPEKVGRGAHGLVLLVDIDGSQDKVAELMKKVRADLEKRKATRLDLPEMHGVKVTKWVFPKPEKDRLRKSRESFHAVVDGWLLAADNENIFREVVRRLVNVGNLQKAETLSAQASFKSVMENTALGGKAAHFRWYIEPFGYLELAQAIEAENDTIKTQDKTDKARILKQQGFDAIRGVGGNLSFATGSHEMLHQTFVYMPKPKVADENQKHVFGLLDFSNKYEEKLTPQPFVPSHVSGYVSGTWDMNKAFENAGHVFDAFLGPDAFNELVEGLKKDAVVRVDVPWMVKQFGNRITIFSATKQIEIKPGDAAIENPEQVAICMQITGEDQDELFDSIRRAMGKESVQMLKLAGHPGDVMLNDTSMAEEAADDDENFLIPDIDLGDDEDEEKEVKQFELFEKRYITMFKGVPGKPLEADGPTFLIIANDKEFLKQILQEEVESPVAKANDYIQIQESIGELVDEKNVVWQQFGRLDKALAANYQLLRHNKMAQSNTVLARLLNQFLAPKGEQQGLPRQQKIDGSKLPEDYENRVAPYFGPMGWAMESSQEGFRITGTMLKKNTVSEVVQKPSDQPRR